LFGTYLFNDGYQTHYHLFNFCRLMI
jgi:hypothetical protein